ncbi:MAG TPA: hypothetical protein VN668_06045 [Stellaceae bacterium]|nr:hypothetical protein [Stellaceae bacterium]
MGWRAVVLILLAALAACDSPRLQATSDGTRGVTYAFPADLASKAARQATLYCANLGRSAVLQGTKHEEDGRVVASYDCR